MTFTSRIRFVARACYEAARWRPGRPRIPTTYRDAREDLDKWTRQRLQEKARYWERNCALVGRLADVFECYTVGSGLQVNPSSSSSAWNEAAKGWWRVWERFADVSSRQTFGTLQGLLARSWFVDGEVFVLLTQGGAPAGKVGRARVQVIEAHRCETPPDRTKDEGVSVVDGVEIDTGNGRPTGYWFWQPGQGNTKVFRLYPAESIVHVFEPSRPGQYRGLPFFTSALNTIDDLDELKRLEMKAARAAAVVANIIKTQSGEVNPLDLIASGGAVSESSSTSEVTAYQEKLGGETLVLKTGEDLAQFQSNRPSVVTREYWRDLQAEVCASAGIPAVLVYPDQMQGTQYRGSLDMAAAFFRSRSAVMQEVVRRIYEYVIGSSKDREKGLEGAPTDYYAVSIQPPRSVNVDVGRNSAAMIAELGAGATNFEMVYGPQGLDWREELKKLSDQLAFASSLGLKLPFLAGPQQPQGAHQA